MKDSLGITKSIVLGPVKNKRRSESNKQQALSRSSESSRRYSCSRRKRTRIQRLDLSRRRQQARGSERNWREIPIAPGALRSGSHGRIVGNSEVIALVLINGVHSIGRCNTI